MKKMVLILLVLAFAAGSAFAQAWFVDPAGSGNYVNYYVNDFNLTTSQQGEGGQAYAGVNLNVLVDGRNNYSDRLLYTYTFSPNDGNGGIAVENVRFYAITLFEGVTVENLVYDNEQWALVYIPENNAYRFRNISANYSARDLTFSFWSTLAPGLRASVDARDTNEDEYYDAVHYSAGRVLSPSPNAEKIVPEPTSIALGAMGLVSVLGLKRRIKS